jgi:hypothetical protein
MRKHYPIRQRNKINEAATLRAVLREADSSVERIWTASWLLTPIHANEWSIRTSKSIKVNGEWTFTKKVPWNDKLPDRSSLSDAQNLEFREFLQKAAFLIREEVGNIESFKSHSNVISLLKTLVKWVFLHPLRFIPAKDHFSRLDTPAISEFLTAFTKGANFAVGEYPQRFLRATGIKRRFDWVAARGKPSLFKLPAPYIEAVVIWLKDNNLYEMTPGNGPNCELNCVNRKKISKLLNCEPQVFNSNSAIAFFRQFEPEYVKKFGNLCVATGPIRTKMLSHRVSTIEETVDTRASRNSTNQMISLITALQELNEILPNSIPSFPEAERSPLGRFKAESPKNDHTPWIPLEYSLKYLNEAIRLILKDGPTLIDFYLKAIAYFVKNGFIDNPDVSDYIGRNGRDDWVRKNLPAELKRLGINGWSAGWEDDTRQDANYFGVANAMTVLVGACIFIISNLAPSRAEEISRLKKLCLSFIDGDGFWLTKPRGKSGIEDQNQIMTVPVPKVVSVAVQHLLRIGNKSQKLARSYERSVSHFLLYLPIFRSVGAIQMNLMQKPAIDFSLDMFCDYVGIPPDKLGRRWYVRIHENRKSFLLTFVWAFKFSVLDAARSLAGHTDIDQIFAYIVASTRGMEISELEADFLAQVLWDFGVSGKRKKSIQNVGALYRRVCQHFHVREISEVSENELKEWLELSIQQENLVLDVFELTFEGRQQRFAVRIVMTNSDAK